MEDKELYNPQNGEVIKAKRPKQFWNDWRFYVYTLIAIMLAIVSFSSCLTACAAMNAGVGQKEDASYSVAQRKNAVITTDGGYSGFQFSISTNMPSVGGDYAYSIYSLDPSTYVPVVISNVSGTLSENSRSGLLSAINNAYSEGRSYATSDTYRYQRLLLCLSSYSYPWNGVGTSYYKINYTTFIEPAYNTSTLGVTNVQTAFVTDDYPSCECLGIVNNTFYQLGINGGFQYFITNQKVDYYVYHGSTFPATLTFQDVVSYYQELGYQNGYNVGNSAGYENGHSAGYNEGYASGNANGYASGYEQATQDYQTGIAFTSYGLYANAQLTLTTDEVIGNYSYMYLFKYVTSNYDEHTVYVLFTQNSSTSLYLGYVLDRNDSDDSTSAVTIGSFSAQSSLAVTITAEQDQYFELYTGFVTSFYDRGSEVIEALWFSGGTSQTALQNYQDGYDTGYQDGVSAGYGSGYDAGYRVGEVAGINQAEPEALTNTLVAVFQQPFNQIYRFFNFNILGLNVLGLATGLLSVFIIIKVFKKVLK